MNKKKKIGDFFFVFSAAPLPARFIASVSPGQLNFVCLRQLLFLFLTFYIFLFLPVRARCNWNSSFNGPSRFLQFSSIFLILLLLLFLKKRTKIEGRKKKRQKNPKRVFHMNGAIQIQKRKKISSTTTTPNAYAQVCCVQLSVAAAGILTLYD